jgi:hypothetical protein
MMIASMTLFLLTSVPASLVFAKEASDSQPQAKTYKGIPYVSGGFGVEDRENLRSMARGDNLELSFAQQNKDYLGGARVLIKDSKGKDMLEANSDGPLFYAKLPQGTYNVEATARGQTLQQVVHIPAKGQEQLYFAWPDRETATPIASANKYQG